MSSGSGLKPDKAYAAHALDTGFKPNKAYADYALENRSMFLRHYYILLLYFSITPAKDVPEELAEAQSHIGKASFIDLTFKLAWRTAVKTVKGSIQHFKEAFAVFAKNIELADSVLDVSPVAVATLLFRTLCVPCCMLGTFIMLPVNAIYGALDWLSLQAAKTYFTHFHQGKPLKDRLDTASYIAFSASMLTVAFRLSAGFVEALQEPLHLYDFWIKGWVDAGEAYKNKEISATVMVAKRFLHCFKAFCTLGAVLSIVGITAIPVLSKLFDLFAKVPHYLIAIKNLMPFSEPVLDVPTNILRDSIISIENGIGHITDIHNTNVSQLTNTNESIDLGYESGLTKFAAILKQLVGFGPSDLQRPAPPPLPLTAYEMFCKRQRTNQHYLQVDKFEKISHVDPYSRLKIV